jgi:hypothetical protein
VRLLRDASAGVLASLASAGLLASLACAAPASAAPPELFVRSEDSYAENASAWFPLAAAPDFGYLGRYQIGYRLQASGFQRAALTIAGVPDGQITQPNNEPYCVGRNGNAGDIATVGAPLQFEGSGRYTVTVSVQPGDGGPSGCLTTGESSTGAFTAGAAVAPALVGEPLAFRAEPLPGDPFVGVRANVPPGGQADTRCALDATVGPDGSVSGRVVMPEPDLMLGSILEDGFSEPGAWTCVSRGVAEGLDDTSSTTFFGTPWSAPLRFDVHSDFKRVRGQLIGPRSRRPRMRFYAEFPKAAAGGRATFTLLRFQRCRGRRAVFKRVARYRGTFGARRVEFRIRRPRRDGWHAGALGFAGSRLIRPSNDPQAVLLASFRRRLEFALPADFPRC